MARGGTRQGAGRKTGGANVMSKKAREEAAKTGELPHEFLLRVSRGEKIGEDTPSLDTRIDAAKAAAPYYAPRLAQVEAAINANVNANINSTIDAPKQQTKEEWIAARDATLVAAARTTA